MLHLLFIRAPLTSLKLREPQRFPCLWSRRHISAHSVPLKKSVPLNLLLSLSPRKATPPLPPPAPLLWRNQCTSDKDAAAHPRSRGAKERGAETPNGLNHACHTDAAPEQAASDRTTMPECAHTHSHSHGRITAHNDGQRPFNVIITPLKAPEPPRSVSRTTFSLLYISHREPVAMAMRKSSSAVTSLLDYNT